jgi:hypothetical protein
MILINKYEPEISIDDAFVNIVHQYNELKKIYEFMSAKFLKNYGILKPRYLPNQKKEEICY